MHRNRTRSARHLAPAQLLFAAIVAVTALVSAPAYAQEHEQQPAGEAATHATAGHAGGAHDAHGAAGHGAAGQGHGPAAAEKIHNWFSFTDRDKYTPIGWVLVNFSILLILLFKFAGKPFRKFLHERHEQAKAALAEAAKLRAEARERLADIEKRVKNLDAEIAQIKKDVAEDAEREKEAIINAAEAEAERIVQIAERTMAEEVKRVQAELEVEAVQAAMAAAEQLLRRQVNDADHARLHKEYLVQLGSGGGN